MNPLSNSGREQRLTEWQAIELEGPVVCVPQLFEAQVERSPEAVAVCCEGEALTYRELNRRANQLAHHLQECGVGPEVLTGLYVERSLEMLVGLLGIMKAGGAYVPLDPAYPRDRIAYILADARAPVIVTQERLASTLPDTSARLICLAAGLPAMAGESDRNPAGRAQAEHLVYLIYTSGSTGKPKGVQIVHRALANFVQSMLREPGLTAQDVLLAVTTPSFDIAGLELFLPLIVGARVVIAPRPAAVDGVRLLQLLRDSTATVMQATPATWQLLLEAGWSGRPRLKVLCGGQSMPRPLAQQLLARSASVWNLYGPTETTIWSTVARVEPGEGTVSIGHPIDNTEIYLLDDHLDPVGPGAPGELCIGGVGLARGYLNRPELTAERFIPHPFRSGPGARLYRTGDRARVRADGAIELLGRIDQQVKVRGFRIELGEIEAALAQHPGVHACAVLARDDAAGDKSLAAYFVPLRASAPSTRELRRFLAAHLPEYMLPAAFVRLDELPLNPNGKLDRQALPAAHPARPEMPHPYTAPRNAEERQLAALWEEILGVHPIGIHDSFFDLAGHSLLAVRLFARIGKRWGRDLPLSALFEAPTVAELAALLRRNDPPDTPGALVAIQPAGSRPPFFCVHGAGGSVLCFRPLARGLGLDQPYYALRSTGLQRMALGPATLGAMAAAYLAAIRTRQPHGPYYLGGYSFGGMVALEMAQQLHAQGERVAFLGLLDTGACDPGVPGSLRQRLLGYARTLRRLPGRAPWPAARKYADRGGRALAGSAWRAAYRVCAAAGLPFPRNPRTVYRLHMEALRAYMPRPYPGRITYFAAGEPGRALETECRARWERLAEGGLEIHMVPGTHATLIAEPAVYQLAERLRDCLERAQRDGRSIRGDATVAARLRTEASPLPVDGPVEAEMVVAVAQEWPDPGSGH